MDLKGRVAVVTGGSRGVGQAIVEALEARGMVVAPVARRDTRHRGCSGRFANSPLSAHENERRG